MTRAKNLPEGFCSQCNKRPVKPGRKRCVECLTHASRYQKKVFAESLQEGLCIACRRRQARSERQTCGPCAKKRRAVNDEHLSNKGVRMLACYVPIEVADAVREAADAKGESLSEWIRTSINRSLGRLAVKESSS